MSASYLQVTMYMSKLFHFQSVSMILGKFAGWLMYLPALPNCVLMFHNSTGGSNTTSFMLHVLVFSSSLIFNMQLVSIVLIMDNSVSRYPF